MGEDERSSGRDMPGQGLDPLFTNVFHVYGNDSVFHVAFGHTLGGGAVCWREVVAMSAADAQALHALLGQIIQKIEEGEPPTPTSSVRKH